ncbi:hypothetical protein GDO78_011521 [Eleutherodactylus coqui]|uniref:Uncharacterized protein n=1 Tax=Eleutherodactylus coqui TaxID=57060 RepID=A0A8J6F2V4_ELECQ|nr:hypothetical protein GDO78_011521 [Eleutherodactylus coqui]
MLGVDNHQQAKGCRPLILRSSERHTATAGLNSSQYVFHSLPLRCSAIFDRLAKLQLDNRTDLSIIWVLLVLLIFIDDLIIFPILETCPTYTEDSHVLGITSAHLCFCKRGCQGL